MTCDQHCAVDVVMEGGGVKGIALIGALAVLEDRGYRWINLAGTSAGAIVAALAAAGYSAQELRRIVGGLDFTQFLDSSPGWLPPRTRALYNVLAHWGVYKGDRFLAWLRRTLADRGVRTFAQLKRGIPDRRQLYSLRVVASDITRGKMLVLPEGIADYGVDPDELEVAVAVRMSMSIPGFFRPVVRHVGTREYVPGRGFVDHSSPCYIVDGALLSNFPIRLFDGPGMDERPTFGLRLTNHGRSPTVRYRATGLVSYLLAMLGTAVGAADAYYLDTHTFLRTVEIDNLGIPPTQFDLGPTERSALYDSGCDAAREFLATWDFDQWKRLYAEWTGTGRRELIRKALTSGP